LNIFLDCFERRTAYEGGENDGKIKNKQHILDEALSVGLLTKVEENVVFVCCFKIDAFPIWFLNCLSFILMVW